MQEHRGKYATGHARGTDRERQQPAHVGLPLCERLESGGQGKGACTSVLKTLEQRGRLTRPTV